MTQGLEPPQSGFKAPRIPFDLRCVLLAAMGYLAMLCTDWALGLAFGHGSGWSLAFFAGIANGWLGVMGLSASDLPWWELLAGTLAFYSVWALFGGALLRCAALRQTRDEPFSFRDALTFGAKNWISFLAAPVIVLVFAAFFTLCNMLAGFVMSLWGVGSSILVLVLFPLVLLSSLLITLTVLGGVLSLPLMWASITVEQNGALEAVSRTFSYLFARPFRFFFGYLLITMLMSVVLFLGGHFENVVKRSLRAGIVRAELDDIVEKPPAKVTHLENPYKSAEKVTRQQGGISDVRNVGDAAWYDKPGFLWMWLMLSFFMLGFKGYAIYVLLGGTASLYLQLRHEVDGTDERDIYPPLDEEADEARWVGEKAASSESQESAETPAEESGNDS